MDNIGLQTVGYNGNYGLNYMYTQNLYSYSDIDLSVRIPSQTDSKELEISSQIKQQNELRNSNANYYINEVQGSRDFQNCNLSYMDLTENTYNLIHRDHENDIYLNNSHLSKQFDFHDRYDNKDSFESSGLNVQNSDVEAVAHSSFNKIDVDISTDDELNEKESMNRKKKLKKIKMAKQRAELKYRMKMTEQYKKLAFTVIGKHVNWKRRQIIEIAVKYILKIRKSNQKLIKENNELKYKMFGCNEESK
jgi:hypothetical protein